MSDEVTLGEVHRILVEVAIDVRRQNGRVRRMEVAVAVLQWGMGLSGTIGLIALGLALKRLFG